MARNFVRASSHRYRGASAPITAYPFTVYVRAKFASKGIVAMAMNGCYSQNGNSCACIVFENRGGQDQLQMLISNGGNWASVASMAAPTTGQWFSVVAVCTDATTAQIYIDGVGGTPTGQSRTIGTFVSTAIGAYDGNDAGWVDHFDGDICDAGIVPYAASAGEVASYAAGFSGRAVFQRGGAGRAHWDFISDQSTEPDNFGGVTLTPNGTPAKADHPRIFMPRRRGLAPKATVSGAVTLNADQGTITVTGYAATARFSVAAAQGVVSVSGQAATVGLGMAAAQGSVGVTGQASTVGFLTAAAQGSVAVTGQAATVNWQMAGAQGSVAITGYDATFDLPATGNITMDADTGTVTIAGFPATVAWAVAADQGSISVSGQAAAVLWGLNADLGTLILTGYAAEFDGVTGISSGVGKPRKGKRRKKVLVGDQVFWSDQKEAIARAIAALQAERAQARAEKVATKPQAAVPEITFAALAGMTPAEMQAMQADEDEDDIECLLLCS